MAYKYYDSRCSHNLSLVGVRSVHSQGLSKDLSHRTLNYDRYVPAQLSLRLQAVSKTLSRYHYRHTSSFMGAHESTTRYH